MISSVKHYPVGGYFNPDGLQRFSFPKCQREYVSGLNDCAALFNDLERVLGLRGQA